MRITYTPNPLATVIELDEHEIEVLKLKLRIEQYEEILFGAHWNLTRTEEYLASLPRPQTVEQSRQAAIDDLDPEYWCGEEGETKLDKRIEELTTWYIEALRSEHCGDCTCVPCSCDKCHVEDLLGINTIKGLGKHEAANFSSQFRKVQTIDEAIHNLETYEFKPPTDNLDAWKRAGGWEQHIPRWKQEVNNALAWLKNYRDTHFTK